MQQSGLLDDVYLQIDRPGNRPFQVIGMGVNAVDWIALTPQFPEPDQKVRLESLRRAGGGQTATACALAARFGLSVQYIGKVGDDEAGQFSRQSLQSEPMDTSQLIGEADCGSQLALILADQATGTRTILWHQDPKLEVRAEEVDSSWFARGELLHLDGHDMEASIAAATYAKQSQMQVSVDLETLRPGAEKLLELADVAVTSRNFVRRFTGELDLAKGLGAMDRAGPALVGATLGEQGVAVLWRGRVYRQPALPVAVVDSTGAGDIFHGAFIYALFQEWSLGRGLRFACAAAGLSCRKVGSRPSIPELEEVLAAASGLEPLGLF